MLHASVGIGMRGDRGVIFYGGRPYLCGMWWWGESWRISIRDLLARLWYVMVGERGVGLQAILCMWAGGEVKNAERAKSWLASGLVVKRQEVWTFRKKAVDNFSFLPMFKIRNAINGLIFFIAT